MANKDLKGKSWKIPKKYLRNLKNKLRKYSGDKHVEGFTRLQNLVQAGKISYENLKNVKHILEKHSDNETLYELNGGKTFHRWINDQLKVARQRLEISKKSKQNGGIENAYKKTHNKSAPSNTRTRRPQLHKSTSSKDITNNNVNYESVKRVKVILSEGQYKKLIKEDEEYKQLVINKTRELLLSGQEENIELAEQLAASVNLDFQELFFNVYGEIIDFMGWSRTAKMFTPMKAVNLISNVTEFDGHWYKSKIINNKLPESFGLLNNLTSVNLGGVSTKISELPASFANLHQLKTLNMAHSDITDFPLSILKLTNLTEINASFSQLNNIPEGISNLKNLTHLNVIGNNLTSLPQSLVRMANLKVIQTRGNKIPKEVTDSLKEQRPKLYVHSDYK